MTRTHHRSDRFLLNLLWSWMGVAASLFTGILLSPYLIHKLGAEGYGVWALSFSLVEYCWFLDLGFRSAIVKYVAHYKALDQPVGINQVINTGLLYAGLAAIGIFAAVVLVSGHLHLFFNVSPALERPFRILVVLISLSWSVSFTFGLFGACLESIQRFDLYNQATALATFIRAGGTAILLYLGYGLIGIGVLTVITQCLGYFLYFALFRHAVSTFRLSPRFASMETLRMMGRFGIHTFVGNVSGMFIGFGPPILIGHFLPAAFVGYYQLPVKLIQYTSDAVARIGIITNANAAELHARGDSRVLSQLAIYSNRYSLTLFMPLALVFWVFGDRIFRLWVPSIAKFSSPLLPILLAAYMIAVVAQFSSGMLLQGLGRHQWFMRGLLIEAVALMVLLILVLPHYGIMGAAWTVAGCMIVNRGLFAPWLVSREMGFRFIYFLHSILTWPFVAAIPVAGLAYFLRITILPGNSWLQLFSAGALVAVSYLGLGFFVCLPAEHRARLVGLALQRLPLRAARAV